MNIKVYQLLKITVFNLFIVSLLGVIMRYKIAFYFPFLEQKHLQEAHSHFAFYGWITNAIYLFIYKILKQTISKKKLTSFYNTIIINLFASYGMLFSFLYSGYYWLSIVFSTVALFCSFYFLFIFYKNYKNLETLSRIWFLGGLLFAVFSSLGVFNLSFMKINHHISQDLYLASTYFYLHFQYNGFFIFSCIGLLINMLENIGAKLNSSEIYLTFWLLFFSCFLGFGLSVLWLELPIWLYSMIVLSSLVQILANVKILFWVRKNWMLILEKFTPLERFILIFVGVAFFAKVLLQLASTIPAISQFAFGFRNIVIAYLHLVLLMCITGFLILKLLILKIFRLKKKFVLGIKLFLLGVFLNELVLGINGILSIKYISLPYSQYILFGISILIMLSLLIILMNSKKNISQKSGKY
jgi:hypothetical protein